MIGKTRDDKQQVPDHVVYQKLDKLALQFREAVSFGKKAEIIDTVIRVINASVPERYESFYNYFRSKRR